MQNCKFTIVVPAYNVERTLEECINSILNQTVMNHKIIIVNDGSKDNTGKIAQKFANDNPEIITYINQENKGLGAARNTGLAIVDTEFVGFLDSDDWLAPDYIEILTDRLSKEVEKPDLIYTMPKVYNMASRMYEPWMDETIFEEVFPTSNTVVNPKTNEKIYGLEPNACRKIYSVSFLKNQNFKFPEGTKWEDVEPHFQLLHASSRCIGEKRTGFIYRINNGGQITSSIGRDRLQVVSVFSRTLSVAISEGWSSVEISYILKMMLNFSKWSMDVVSIYIRPDLINALHLFYKSVPKNILKDYYKIQRVRKKDKLLILIMRSRFYKMLGDAFTYKNGKRFLSKVKRMIKRR